MTADEILAHPNMGSLEWDEQAAVHMILKSAEGFPPTVVEAMHEGAQALLDGQQFDEEGQERASGMTEGIILVLGEVADSKSGPGAMALRAMVQGVCNDEHHTFHPQYEA